MTSKQLRIRITNNATNTVINRTCAVKQVYISVADASSSWKLKIQDRGSPAFVLVPEVTLAAQDLADWRVQGYDEALTMQDGIDVVTTGGTPGEVALWINVLVNQ